MFIFVMHLACCSYDQLREMTRGKTVVVLPAFETAPQKNMTLAHDLADTAAMMNKEQLGRLVQKRLIYQFALYLFRQVRQQHTLCMEQGYVDWRCLLQHNRHANNRHCKQGRNVGAAPVGLMVASMAVLWKSLLASIYRKYYGRTAAEHVGALQTCTLHVGDTYACYMCCSCRVIIARTMPSGLKRTSRMMWSIMMAMSRGSS
jgi:hypothetical protein